MLMHDTEINGEIALQEEEELKMQANKNLGLYLSAARDPYSSFRSFDKKYLNLKYSKKAKLSNSQCTQLRCWAFFTT